MNKLLIDIYELDCDVIVTPRIDFKMSSFGLKFQRGFCLHFGISENIYNCTKAQKQLLFKFVIQAHTFSILNIFDLLKFHYACSSVIQRGYIAFKVNRKAMVRN